MRAWTDSSGPALGTDSISEMSVKQCKALVFSRMKLDLGLTRVAMHRVHRDMESVNASEHLDRAAQILDATGKEGFAVDTHRAWPLYWGG